MKKREYEFWHMISNGLPEVHFTRIEPSYSATGVFDVNGCWAGVEAWIELKINHAPLRPSQRGWGVARYRAGGNLFILSLTPDFLKLWTFERGVIAGNYPQKPDAKWRLPITDWAAIRSIIFNATWAKERINDYKRYSTFGV